MWRNGNLENVTLPDDEDQEDPEDQDEEGEPVPRFASEDEYDM